MHVCMPIHVPRDRHTYIDVPIQYEYTYSIHMTAHPFIHKCIQIYSRLVMIAMLAVMQISYRHIVSLVDYALMINIVQFPLKPSKHINTYL